MTKNSQHIKRLKLSLTVMMLAFMSSIMVTSFTSYPEKASQIAETQTEEEGTEENTKLAINPVFILLDLMK